MGSFTNRLAPGVTVKQGRKPNRIAVSTPQGGRYYISDPGNNQSVNQQKPSSVVMSNDPRYMSIRDDIPTTQKLFIPLPQPVSRAPQSRPGVSRRQNVFEQTLANINRGSSGQSVSNKQISNGVSDRTLSRIDQVMKREENLRTRFIEPVYQSLRITDKESENWGVRFAKTAARFPFELASMPSVYGGRLAMAIDLARSREGRKYLAQAGRETPRAVVQSLDIRKPEGAFNVLLTVVGARSLGKSRASAIKAEAELKTAKITTAKVTVKKISKGIGSKSKYEVTKKGILKVGNKKVPFVEKSIVTRDRLSNVVNSKNVSRFTIGKRRVTVKTVSKGKQISYQRATGRGSVPVTESSGVIRGRGIKEKFISRLSGKKGTTMTSGKLVDSMIKSTIKRVRNPFRDVTVYDLKAITRNIPRATLIAKLKNVSKGLTNKINRFSGRAKSKAIAQRNRFMNIAKKLAASKKASLSDSLPRPGDLFQRTPGRDMTAVDKILSDLKNNLERVSKSEGEPIGSKARIRSISKSKFRPDMVDPSMQGVFAGARSVLIPKTIVFPIFLSGTKTGTGVISGAVSKFINDVPPEIIDKVIPIPDIPPGIIYEPIIVPDTVPTTGSSTYNSYYSSSIASTFFEYVTSYNIVNYITPRIIPLLPLMPGISSKASSAFYARWNGVSRANYNYIPDLQSILYGRRASKSQINLLLRPGRVFSGLESRPIV